MSELKEFKSSDDFRQQLKNFLLKERNMQTQNQSVVNTQRYSFEIQADLKKTIDEKLSQSGRKLQKQCSQKNTEYLHHDNMADCNNDDDQDNDNAVANDVDDSFMALELMCNKTASDPESTLFQYMHSDCKESVLENVKQRHSKEHQQEESVEPFIFGFNAKMLNTDETQLDDIEEPSKFWEQTISNGNSMLTTSPVKMVGLLRPSTIMEEKDEEYSLISTNSNDTKTNLSSAATTSNYATAADTTSSTQAKSEMPYYSLRNSLESMASTNCEELSPTKSVSTVKAATTYWPVINESNNESLLDDSVIEIMSDDEGSKLPESSDHLNTEISDLLNLSTYDDKENCETSLHTPEENKDSPREFNDTMEEVEYMMKKGMEIMANAAKNKLLSEEDQPKYVNENKCSNILKVHTTPNRNADFLSPHFKSSSNKPSSMQNKFKIKPNENSASKVSSPTQFVVKPVPKFEMKFKKNEFSESVFKRPMPGSASKPNALQHRKAKQFDHIVSPIGMYVKHTSKTPLMTNMHSKNLPTNERDLINTTVFRNLEKADFTNSKQTAAATPSAQPPVCILPKKAYISSKFKHMVDKRTPITVPGGNSIQQYIKPTLLPTVVRHEGKMHLNPLASQIPQPERNVNDSLKDLSIMSGDVSLLTIKNARKF